MSARLAPRVSAAILQRPPGRFHIEADPGPLSTPKSDGAKLGCVSVDVVDGHAEPIRELACTYEPERRQPCAIEQFDRATRYGLYVLRAQDHRGAGKPHCQFIEPRTIQEIARNTYG